jgi:hypothetical protein
VVQIKDVSVRRVIESGILKYYGIPWHVSEAARTEWDGKSLEIDPSAEAGRVEGAVPKNRRGCLGGYMVLHELAHWLLAADSRRHKSQFLLNPWKRQVRVGDKHSKREEFRAFVLSLIFGYTLGMTDIGLPSYFKALNYTNYDYGIHLGVVGLRCYTEGVPSDTRNEFESTDYHTARGLRIAFEFLDRNKFLRSKFATSKAQKGVWETFNGLIVVESAERIFGAD